MHGGAAAGSAPGVHGQQQQDAHIWSEKPLPRFEFSQSPGFAPAAAAASPGGPFSPMSMELTNDTLQQDAAAAAAAAAAARGTPSGRRAAADNDISLTLDASGAVGGVDGTGTFNITDNVPGLSTLVEEDEEAFAAELAGNAASKEPADVAGAAGGEAGAAEGGDATAEMDLTGLTSASGLGAASCAQATPRSAGLPSPSPGRYHTRRSSRGDATGAADAPLSTPVAVTPTAGGRSGGARAAESISPMIMLSPPSTAKVTPARRGSRARGSSAGAGCKSPGALALVSPASVSPSPLRRSARLSAGKSPSPLPIALRPVPEEEAAPGEGAADLCYDGERQEMQLEGEEQQEQQRDADDVTEALPSPLPLSPVATEVVGPTAGAAGARRSSVGGGRRLSLRSTGAGRRMRGSSFGITQQTVDTAALRDKWGFVPGDDDNTMALELDRHGEHLGAGRVFHLTWDAETHNRCSQPMVKIAVCSLGLCMHVSRVMLLLVLLP